MPDFVPRLAPNRARPESCFQVFVRKNCPVGVKVGSVENVTKTTRLALPRGGWRLAREYLCHVTQFQRDQRHSEHSGPSSTQDRWGTPMHRHAPRKGTNGQSGPSIVLRMCPEHRLDETIERIRLDEHAMNARTGERRQGFFSANDHASGGRSFLDDVAKPSDFPRIFMNIDDDDFKSLSRQLNRRLFGRCGFRDLGSSVDEQKGRRFTHEIFRIKKQDVGYVRHGGGARSSDRAEASMAAETSVQSNQNHRNRLIFQVFEAPFSWITTGVNIVCAISVTSSRVSAARKTHTRPIVCTVPTGIASSKWKSG